MLQFLSNMDAQAWRTLAVSFLLFGGVGLVFLFGAQVLGFSGESTVEQWLGAASGPWSLPVAVAAFAVLAFVIPTQLLQRISLVMMHSLGRPGAGVKTHSIFLVMAVVGSVIGVSYGPEGVAVAVLASSISGACIVTAAATSMPRWKKPRSGF